MKNMIKKYMLNAFILTFGISISNLIEAMEAPPKKSILVLNNQLLREVKIQYRYEVASPLQETSIAKEQQISLADPERISELKVITSDLLERFAVLLLWKFPVAVKLPHIYTES